MSFAIYSLVSRRNDNKINIYTEDQIKMKHIKLFRTLLACLFISAYISPSHATVLVSQGVNYGYGLGLWNNMSATLDAASGNSIDVAPDFSNLGQMLTYDALWLDQRWTNGSLSASEVVNLTSYIATGRRVVMVGENSAWTNWNNQILGIVGGSFDSQFSGSLTTVVANELTAGVNTVSAPLVGVAALGGTSLFDKNAVTLWGAGNVLTMLDVNICADNNWGANDNATFCGNVASWISTPASVPEPSIILLLGSGLALFGFLRRKA